MTSTPVPPPLDVLRLAAFADGPGGGNPAGVVLDARGASRERMQALAAEVGYAETAFVVDTAIGGDERRVGLRFFSPDAEVPFCGHATVATAVALAEVRGTGPFAVQTPAGAVDVVTTRGGDGRVAVAFTSVEPVVAPLDEAVADRLLGLLGLRRADLEPAWPLRTAFAGNTHPVVAVADPAVFDAVTYEPAPVRALMDEQGWAGTVAVVTARPTDPARPGALVLEARNVFPVGDLLEDPATGSAAAALGAYLRAVGALTAPARLVVHQGRHVGRPSLLLADVPATGGVTVHGGAEPLDARTELFLSGPGPVRPVGTGHA